MGLQISVVVVFLCMMFYFVSYEGRSRYENMGITQIEKRRISSANTRRLVALIDERDRKREIEKLNPTHRAQRLDDGLQDDIPIQDLLKGLKGFL